MQEVEHLYGSRGGAFGRSDQCWEAWQVGGATSRYMVAIQLDVLKKGD